MVERIIQDGSFSLTSLRSICEPPGPLRCTPKYLEFWTLRHGDLLTSDTEHRRYRLSQLLAEIPKKLIGKGVLDEPVVLVEYSDILKGFGIILHPVKVDYVGSTKVLLSQNTFSYGKLDPDGGRVFISPADDTVLASSEFVPLRVDERIVRPKFLQLLLLLPESRWAMAMIKAGKCQQRAGIDKLMSTSLVVPSIVVQDKFLRDNSKVLEQMTELARNIPSYIDIVDRGFVEEFHCAIPSISRVNSVSMNILANNRLVRLGFRVLTMEQAFQSLLSNIGSTTPLNTIATARGGKRLPKGTQYSQKPTSYRYLRGIDLGNGAVNEESLMFIDQAAFDSIRRFAAKEDDVAITIAGVVGKVAILTNLGNLGVTENVALIRPRHETEVLAKYLMYLLQTSFIQFQMKKEMSELRQQKLSLEKLREIRVPLPPSIPVQKRILATIDTGFERERDILRRLYSAKTQLDDALRRLLGVRSTVREYVTDLEIDEIIRGSNDAIESPEE